MKFFLILASILVLFTIGIVGIQESFAPPGPPNIWITDLSHNPISEGKAEETFLINIPIAYNYHGQCVWQDNIVKNLEIISGYDDEKCQTSFVLILQVTNEDNIVELLVWQNLTLTAKENKTIQIFWTPSTYGNYEVSGYFWKSLEDYTALTSKKIIVFPINEIQCNDSFTLLHKFDNSTVCVKPSTAEKLIERGWTNQVIKQQSKLIPSTWIGTIPIQCGNEWDEYTYELIQEDISKSIYPTSYEDRLDRQIVIIQQFYEQKGAEIFDKKIIYDVVPAALCEGCGCNAGGHGFYFLASNDSLDLFENWHAEYIIQE